MKKVNVAIQSCGKPFETALNILALLEHSGQHINKLFFTREKYQIHGDATDWVPYLLYRVRPDISYVVYNVPHYIHFKATHGYLEMNEVEEPELRYSLPYQYAWENTDRDFLFIMHNDTYPSGDVIGHQLSLIEGTDYAGVGQVGQCWNCPAKTAGVCDGDKYFDYRPTYDQALHLLQLYHAPRMLPAMIDPLNPWPLSECRVNEFACMFNVPMLKNDVFPLGPCHPLGLSRKENIDVGASFFRDLSLLGFKFKNDIQYWQHARISNGLHGTTSFRDKDLYEECERIAREELEQIVPSQVIDEMIRNHQQPIDLTENEKLHPHWITG